MVSPQGETMNSTTIFLSITGIFVLFSGSLFSAQQKLGHAPNKASCPKLAITHLDHSPKTHFAEQCKKLGDAAVPAVKACAAALCIQKLIPLETTDEQLKAKLKNPAFRCQFLEHLKEHIETVSSCLGFFDVNKTITQQSDNFDVRLEVTKASSCIDNWLRILQEIRSEIHEFSISDALELRRAAKNKHILNRQANNLRLNKEELLSQALCKLYTQENETQKITAIIDTTKAINRKVRSAIIFDLATTPIKNWVVSKINSSSSNKQ